MTTRLESQLKREISVAGEAYTLTIAPEGLKLVRKGHRKGYEISWSALLSGETSLAMALGESLDRSSKPADDDEHSD